MISLTVGAVTVVLPEDLLWEDEFSYTAVEKKETRSLTGARIVQVGTRLGGRPITLAPPDDNAAWMTRAVAEQLFAWAQVPDLVATLSLRGFTRSVEFRSNEVPFESRPVQHYSDVQADDAYLVTLRMTET